jgi:uncharacterized delta-60 repeat protein
MEARTLLSSGAIDTSFGNGGVVTGVPGSLEVVQSTGKIVLASSSGQTWSLERYNADGSVDTTFGKNGIVTTTIGRKNTLAGANGITLGPNDEIIVAGFANETYSGKLRAYTNSAAVAVYNANGTLNTSFNGTGVAFSQISSNAADWGGPVAVQANGEIVIAGGDNPNTTNVVNLYQYYLARFTTSGKLDPTFGTGGQFVFTPDGHYPSSNSYVEGLTIDPATGNLITVGVTGPSQGESAIVEFNPNGTPDTTFGNGGVLLNNSGQTWSSVIVQPPTNGGASANEFVVAGTATLSSGGYGQLVFRLTGNGSLDPTFGNGGSVVTTVPNADLWGNVVTQAPDSSLIVGGSYQIWYSSTGGPVVAKYSANGVLDTTFQNSTSPVPGVVVGPSGNGSSVMNLGIVPHTGGYDIVLATEGELIAWDPPLVGSGSATSVDSAIVPLGTLWSTDAASPIDWRHYWHGIA